MKLAERLTIEHRLTELEAGIKNLKITNYISLFVLIIGILKMFNLI